MDQCQSDMEDSLDLEGPSAISERVAFQSGHNNSSSRPLDAINESRNVRHKHPRIILRLLCKRKYLLCIIALVFVAMVIRISLMLKERGSGLTEKYSERISWIFDNKIDPCQDFSRFSCTASISAGANKSFIESTMGEAEEIMPFVIKSILEDTNTDNELRAVTMAKGLYNNCMHNTTSFSSYYDDWSWLPINLDGYNWPIADEEWNQTDYSLEGILAQMFAHNIQSLFSIKLDEDRENTSAYLFTFNLLRPQAKFFKSTINIDASDNEELQNIVHVKKGLIKLLDASKCEKNNGDTLGGRNNNYTKVTLDYINREIPQINWTSLVQSIFDALDLQQEISSEMIVNFPCFEFFHGFGKLIEETGKRKVANFFVVSFAITFLEYLDSALFQGWGDSVGDLQTNEIILRTLKWRNCVRMVMDGFAIPITHSVKQTDYYKLAESTVQEMTGYLKMAFRHVITNQAWIPETTGMEHFKNELIEKLMQMKLRIGYTKKIMNGRVVDGLYGGLVMNESSYILNLLKMQKFVAKGLVISVMAKSVGAEEPQFEQKFQVGSYIPSSNEIVIPVDLLLYPMFDVDYPMYLNFANLGFILAHEMAHGFDNTGLQYDKYGKFTSWWPEDALIAFRNKASCFVDQYGKYKLPLLDKFVDGNKTLGENLSDNLAFELTLLAYELWAKDRKVKEHLLSGLNFTIPQIFYIAFGQIWCELSSKEMSERYSRDVHSPHPLRVKGVVQNSVNFGSIFGCPAGSAMNPIHKCSLWSIDNSSFPTE